MGPDWCEWRGGVLEASFLPEFLGGFHWDVPFCVEVLELWHGFKKRYVAAIFRYGQGFERPALFQGGYVFHRAVVYIQFPEGHSRQRGDVFNGVALAVQYQ